MSWQVLFQQREMRISWRLCNNSETHLWLWKMWSLAVCSQSSFYVTGARSDDKDWQNKLFLCWKKMNLVPNKQLLLNLPFQSTEYRRKKLCVNNKVQETIGDVYCPTCRNEKCVYILTIQTASFFDFKKCKACCHVLKIPFRDQNRHLCSLVAMAHIVLQGRRVSITKKSELPFLKKLLRQSQPSTAQPERKKNRSYLIYGLIVSTPHWLIQLTKPSFTLFSFYTLSVYSKAT